MTRDILIVYLVAELILGTIYYLIHEFTSIYNRNNRQLRNYTVAEVLLTVFFLPIELTVISFTAPNLGLGKLLSKRPFRKQILKVGDKVFHDGKTREVLEVRFDEHDFEERVRLSGYSTFEFSVYRSKELKKISPLEELL